MGREQQGLSLRAQKLYLDALSAMGKKGLYEKIALTPEETEEMTDILYRAGFRKGGITLIKYDQARKYLFRGMLLTGIPGAK